MQITTVNKETNTVTIDGKEFKIGDEVVKEVSHPDNTFGYIIFGNGVLICVTATKSTYARNAYSVGNWFATKEEAELELLKRRLTHKLLTFIARENLNNNFVPIFNNIQSNFYVDPYNYVNPLNYTILNSCSHIHQDKPLTHYFNKDTYEKIRNIFTDDELILIYLGIST